MWFSYSSYSIMCFYNVTNKKNYVVKWKLLRFQGSRFQSVNQKKYHIINYTPLWIEKSIKKKHYSGWHVDTKDDAEMDRKNIDQVITKRQTYLFIRSCKNEQNSESCKDYRAWKRIRNNSIERRTEMKENIRRTDIKQATQDKGELG